MEDRTLQIIAFSGKRGSGKSTCADHLVEKYGALKLSFATELREELINCLDYPRELIYAKPTPDAIRHLLISHGAARRYIEPDYWVRKVIKQLATPTVYGSGLVVIDDLRYWNEADRLKMYGATLVRVERIGHQQFLPGVDNDASECDLDMYGDWDHTLVCYQGDLNALTAGAEMVVGK